MNYVKFVQGTLEQWQKFTSKDDDTLYFISAPDGTVNQYLGARLISCGGTGSDVLSLDALLDVILSNVEADQLLVYDAEQHAWVNKSLEDGLSVFIGSNADANGKAGLVPAPEAGKSDLFLKADGTWAAPVASRWIVSYENADKRDHADIIVELVGEMKPSTGDMIIINDAIGEAGSKCAPYVFNESGWVPLSGLVDADDVYLDGETLRSVLAALKLQADNKTIVSNNQVLSLYNFGAKYYEFDSTSGEYIERVVDEEHPWKSGLEPRVVSENDELVIGWYEPNTSTTEEIKSALADLQTSVTDLTAQLNNTNTAIATKANAADVYTKSETDAKIGAAVASADHLKRVAVDSLADIDVDAADAGQYIYMVASGLQEDDNRYYEYMVIDGQLEPVGTWEVDLTDYAKKTDLTPITTSVSNIEAALNNKVEKVDNARLMTENEGLKLAGIADGAQVNIIDSVDDTAFSIDANKKLILKDLSASKITGLEALLNGKVDKVEGSRLMSEDEAAKLDSIEPGATKNYITSTTENFKVENGLLSLVSISASHVADLTDLLAGKADKTDLTNLQTAVTGLEERVEELEDYAVWGSLDN